MPSDHRSKARVRELGEVWTPMHIVSDMLDLLPDAMFTPDGGEHGGPATFLEPACGNGNFLEAIYRRKVAAGTDPLDALSSIDPGNVADARERLIALATSDGVASSTTVDHCHVICGDALKLDLTDPAVW